VPYTALCFKVQGLGDGTIQEFRPVGRFLMTIFRITVGVKNSLGAYKICSNTFSLVRMWPI